MRIVAGKLGGRQFNAPHGHRTHPMGEKVRAAVFNVLGDISGLTVLDAYAGSGALAFEALSRGAASAVLVDNDKNAAMTVKDNIRSLGLQTRTKFIQAPIRSWSSTNESSFFDVVFCDPPYNHISTDDIEVITKHIGKDGILVISLPPEQPELQFGQESLTLAAHKDYGDARLYFYR